MISDVRTIAFLAVLAALFYLIHVLYHKKHMDFAAVVMVGTGLGLVLGLAIQFVAGFPDKPMEVAFVAETTTWFAMFGSGYINLIKMIVVPLVMISIMQVIINMQQGSSMAKLVKKTLLVTMGMIAIASVTGRSERCSASEKAQRSWKMEPRLLRILPRSLRPSKT